MRDKLLIFGSPEICQEEIDEVSRVMESGWLGTGPRVLQFEKDFAEYKNAKNAIALNSCTAALHLSILAAGIQEGDEVITTPMTFCASVNAIIHAGAIPVLVDIDPLSLNLDTSKIEEKITDKTKAILPVHFAGAPCDMDEICRIAEQYNLKVIEDCAHAIETEYRGRKAGTIGDFGCFSFYVTKNVVTGEGGMILTNDQAASDRVRVLSLHGMSKDAWKRFSDHGYKHYQIVECGYKYNMMDLQAAIGLHQLSRVEENWQRRKNIWHQYNEAFKNLPVQTPLEISNDSRHGYHLYTVILEDSDDVMSRDAFLEAMNENNIGVGVHYLSIPEHPYYQQTYDWNSDDYPNARFVGRQTVSLPLSAKLSEADVQDVIEATVKLLS